MATNSVTRQRLSPTATPDQLVAKLLSLGGTDVLRYTFDHLPPHALGWLLEQGQVFDGQVVVELDKPQECHTNTYWRTFLAPHLHAVSGFALVKSHGAWVAHSWIADDQRPGIIIETTHARDMYFGLSGLLGAEILYYQGADYKYRCASQGAR